MKPIPKRALPFVSTLALFVFAAVVSGRGSPEAPVPLQTGVKLEQVVAQLEHHVPQLMKDADVAGLGIGLLRDGELVWQHGFGVKNSKTKEPVDDTTVFEAASLSKPVFACAVLKLVDEGKFGLDKPLNQYLPGNYDVGEDARLGKITARLVLSHTTGFPNWRTGGKLKIHFTPGERFSYSGEGMVYLSKVIEPRHGRALQRLHETHGFRAARHDEQQLRLGARLRKAQKLSPQFAGPARRHEQTAAGATAR